MRDWHAARAELIAAAIEAELGADGVGAFLVWGDPSVYDSMLRIVDQVLGLGTVAFTCTVIPGVTSVQALAAAHRIPLNRVGEPIHITPARRLAELPEPGLPDGLDSAVVMLDRGFTAAGFGEPGLEVYWGAYLSTPDEVLISGPPGRRRGGDHRHPRPAAGAARLDHGHLPGPPELRGYGVTDAPR